MKALLLTCGRSEGAFATMARVSAVAARIMPVDIYSLDTQPLEEFSALLSACMSINASSRHVAGGSIIFWNGAIR
jgi:hypothetical protein